MSKPISSAHELGRAIGYNLDPRALLDELKSAPMEQWTRAIREYAQRAANSASRSAPNLARRMWLVVKIENGVPVMIDAYADKHSANRREKFLLQHHRPERDSVRVIQIDLRDNTKDAKDHEKRDSSAIKNLKSKI